jgi:hypothetical protein
MRQDAQHDDRNQAEPDREYDAHPERRLQIGDPRLEQAMHGCRTLVGGHRQRLHRTAGPLSPRGDIADLEGCPGWVRDGGHCRQIRDTGLREADHPFDRVLGLLGCGSDGLVERHFTLFLIWSLATAALVMAERNRTMSASAAELREAIPASRPSPRNWRA